MPSGGSVEYGYVGSWDGIFSWAYSFAFAAMPCCIAVSGAFSGERQGMPDGCKLIRAMTRAFGLGGFRHQNPHIFFLPTFSGVAPTTSDAVAAFFTHVSEYGIKSVQMGGGRICFSWGSVPCKKGLRLRPAAGRG